MVRLTDLPAMTKAVDLGHKAAKQNKKNCIFKLSSADFFQIQNQDGSCVPPDLGPNSLQRLSADKRSC